MLSNSFENELELQHMGELSYGPTNIFNLDVDRMKKLHPNLDISVEKHKTNTLTRVLDSHHISNIIDYLSIDVEGMEFDILKVFDFQKYHINTLTIEHAAAHIGLDYRNKIYKLLTEKNFSKLGF